MTLASLDKTRDWDPLWLGFVADAALLSPTVKQVRVSGVRFWGLWLTRNRFVLSVGGFRLRAKGFWRPKEV